MDGTCNADGSKHRKWVTSEKSSKDLKEKVRQLKSAIENNGATFAGNISFYDYAIQWVETAKGSRSAKTREIYSGCIKRNFKACLHLLFDGFYHF